ncbi:hypothetical protein FA13DRAFT_1805743 [Coprinellus micaceus]|uniref:Uncharacterized protein n=1 Tax=Coprinellus micaceus TaxID=71717 RepID=A0A4Y7RXZ8_COPMI|nr:hypothetical protein FA13DRAFT_1805743 [Coprinellus micaceus]
MAHASEIDPNISNSDLLNFLPITQGVCQPEIQLNKKSEDLIYLAEYGEAHAQSFSKPTLEHIHGKTNHEEILQINEMVIEGPTSHVRLLVSLAKRGVLDERLVLEVEIKRCLLVSLQILAKRREKGNARFRDDKDFNEARFEYWSAEKLAAALVDFDEVTKGKYSRVVQGARKELVLNLGNSAEMSMGLQYFDRALVFAAKAVQIAGTCSGLDEVDQKVALKDRFHQRSLAIQRNAALIGHDKFEKIALGAGVVKALFQIAKNGKMHMEGVFTSYFAAEGLWNLIVIGTQRSDESWTKQFIEEHDVVDWCLKAASSAFFVCQRTIGVMGLSLLVTQCFLYEFLTTEKMSEMMKTLSQCILSSPKLWIDQMRDPATTWQSLYCFGTIGTPTAKAGRYAPRYYALFQGHAAWTIVNLVGRYPVPEQSFYNDLIRQDPQLLDLLLECAGVKREAWYPQLEVDARTAEALIFMLSIPAEVVPGLEVQVDDRVIQARLEQRWRCLMEGVGLLMARPL